MRVKLVARETNRLDATLLPLGGELGNLTELGRADGGEIASRQIHVSICCRFTSSHGKPDCEYVLTQGASDGATRVSSDSLQSDTWVTYREEDGPRVSNKVVELDLAL